MITLINPGLAYSLLIIGFYGIFFEIMNPGFIFPGIIGIFSVAAALYGLVFIPANYWGLIPLILGIGFMILEGFFCRRRGSLGLVGVIAFVWGSTVLFNTPDYSLPWSLIAIATVISAVFFSSAFLGWLGAHANNRSLPVMKA